MDRRPLAVALTLGVIRVPWRDRRNDVVTMESYWDSLADQDAGFYTATAHRHLDARYFVAGGTEASSFVDKFNLPNGQSDSLLEIGCGIGRMTQSFSSMYSRVFAVDISSVMLAKAKNALAGCPNVELRKVSGDGKLPFKEASFSAVFSYIVLQHIPSQEVQQKYIAETSRVLVPGGVAAIQLRRANPYAKARNVSARMVHSVQSRNVSHPAWKGASLSKSQLRQISLVNSTMTLDHPNLLHRWIRIEKKPLEA